MTLQYQHRPTFCVELKATSQLVTRSSRHTVMSSHSQLVTSERITKSPVVIFFHLHAGQVAPRNSAQNGRRNYGKRAISKSLTTAKLLNATNARSKRTVISSQHRQARRSTRHTILRCDELTGSRIEYLNVNWILKSNDENAQHQ